MKTKSLWTLVVGGVAAMALASGAMAQQTKPEKETQPAKVTQPTTTDKGHTDTADKAKKEGEKAKKDTDKKDDHKAAGVEPGQPAPAFTLKDTDGKDVSLAEFVKAGNIVVLQWFNPECPFVVKHYKETKTFNELHAKYASKGVTFLAINSGAPGEQGSGAKANAEMKNTWAIPYPILLDDSGSVGKAYGAKNTPTMVVIGKDGKVAYFGAIDDDNGAAKPGKTNYVAKALDELIAGSNVTTPKTKPYGCAVKYGKSKG